MSDDAGIRRCVLSLPDARGRALPNEPVSCLMYETSPHALTTLRARM